MSEVSWDVAEREREILSALNSVVQNEPLTVRALNPLTQVRIVREVSEEAPYGKKFRLAALPSTATLRVGGGSGALRRPLGSASTRGGVVVAG